MSPYRTEASASFLRIWTRCTQTTVVVLKMRLVYRVYCLFSMFPTALQTIVCSDGWTPYGARSWKSTDCQCSKLSLSNNCVEKIPGETAGTQSISNRARYRHFINAFKSLSLASVINKAGWTAPRQGQDMACHDNVCLIFGPWMTVGLCAMIIRRQLRPCCRKFLSCTEVWRELEAWLWAWLGLLLQHQLVSVGLACRQSSGQKLDRRLHQHIAVSGGEM